MSAKFGLGRGMMALVDENELDESVKKESINISVDNIMPNRYQPRKNFNEAALQELADSIKEKGVIQPIIVTELGGGRYELVAGERRLRASKLAGMKDIPALIRNFTDNERLEIALIENIQREELNPIEEALAYKEIMEKLSVSQEEMARRVGKNRSSVANTLRLLKLPEQVREQVAGGEISEGHARAILSLNDMDKMLAFARWIIETGASVREAEEASKTFGTAETVRPETNQNESRVLKDNPLVDLEERFIKTLGAKVQIKGSHKKGRIEIHYFSKEELENIYKAIAERKNG